MVKKQHNKETFNKRAKLKEQRLMRLKARHKISAKKKDNEELLHLVTSESIEELTLKQKLKTIEALYDLIIAYPENNADKLKLMLLFLKDSSVVVIAKAVELLQGVFNDVLPSYRLTIADSKQKESKDIEAIHSYERTLSDCYEEYIKSVSILDKAMYKNANCDACRLSFCSSIKELFERFYYFNHEELLINFLIDKLADENKEIKANAFQGLYNVLAMVDNSVSMLNLKILMIKRISNSFYSKPHDRYEANALELLSAHKIEFPDISNDNDKKADLSDIKYGSNGGKFIKNGTKAENRIAKKGMKSFEKEKSKIVKSLQKEMRDIEGSSSTPRMIYYSNLKILKKVLFVYFDILKNKTTSPLIAGVFTGVSALCENINVEILLDLQKCIYNLISALLKRGELSTSILALKANLSIAQKLTKVIVSIQDTYLITSSYEILCALCADTRANPSIKEDLFMLFEVIELILLKSRMFSVQTIAAFIKRLAILASYHKTSCNIPMAIMLLMKRILSKYSDVSFLIEDDGEPDQFNYALTSDPEYCNAKSTSIITEIKSIVSNYAKNKLIKQVGNYILKGEKVRVELACLNYYDVLLK